MAEHYTRATVSVTLYCGKCGKQTTHTVSDRRRGYCIPCMERLEGKTPAPPATATASGRAVMIEIPCRCRSYTFAHYHADGKRRSDVL